MSELPKKQKRQLAKLVFSTLLVTGVVAIAQPSFAVTIVGPIDQLKLETAKVQGVFDLVVPTAVASTVFAIGAVLLKRVAFS